MVGRFPTQSNRNRICTVIYAIRHGLMLSVNGRFFSPFYIVVGEASRAFRGEKTKKKCMH